MKYVAVFHARPRGALGFGTEVVHVAFDAVEGAPKGELHDAAWKQLRTDSDRYYEKHEHFSGPHRYLS